MASFSRVAGRVLLIVLVLFGLMQLVRPARTNPPTDPARALPAHVRVPDNVSAILARSCRDCHTHDTRWPWYSTIAPVSWLVVRDVNEGREHLNFATWAMMSRGDQREALEEICEEVRKDNMPIGLYVSMHAEAALSRGDIDTLCGWTAATLAEAHR